MLLETKDPAIDGIAQAARAFGFIDEIAYRNICFKCEFERLTIDRNVEEVLTEMSNKYFLSYEQMKKICYQTGVKKEITDKIITTIAKIPKRNKRVVYIKRTRK